jgi:hypothetical protein
MVYCTAQCRCTVHTALQLVCTVAVLLLGRARLQQWHDMHAASATVLRQSELQYVTSVCAA